MMNAFCPSSCPVVAAGREAFAFPPGQIHRVGAVSPSPPKSVPGEIDETKRNVLKLLLIAGGIGAAGGGLIGGTIQFAQPPLVGLSSYPRVPIIDVDGLPLTVNKALAEYNGDTSDVYTFNYPLTNEPNFLINLAPGPSGVGAKNVVGGIGPEGTIVAFSAICQHLGCPAPAIHYYPPNMCPQTFNGLSFYIHCTCHGSTYDVTKGAANLTGPAVLPLPQVTLEEAADGTISAVGVTGPPVNGHIDTLKGSYGVGTSTSLAKTSPVLLCNFP